MGVVKCINVYPVKSCKPMSLSSAVLTPTGFMFDRQWTIVRTDTGKFVTQRQLPKLALVEATLPVEVFACASAEAICDIMPDAALILTTPGGTSVSVPVFPTSSAPTRQVTVWAWSGLAADEGEAAAECLSAYLGLPVRLVRYIGSAGHQQRMGSLQSAAHAVKEEGSGALVRNTTPEFAVGFETSFADGFPLLLTSEVSMNDLNTRIPGGLAVNRFRGNLVIDGEAAWTEDSWRDVAIISTSSPDLAPIPLVNVKPCERCKVPTIEQETGSSSGNEPLDALKSFRTGALLGWAQHRKSFTHSVFFGVNLVPVGRCGLVSVGDQVRQVSVRTEGPFVPLMV